jgi:hypothetical protein
VQVNLDTSISWNAIKGRGAVDDKLGASLDSAISFIRTVACLIRHVLYSSTSITISKKVYIAYCPTYLFLRLSARGHRNDMKDVKDEAVYIIHVLVIS